MCAITSQVWGHTGPLVGHSCDNSKFFTFPVVTVLMCVALALQKSLRFAQGRPLADTVLSLEHIRALLPQEPEAPHTVVFGLLSIGST